MSMPLESKRRSFNKHPDFNKKILVVEEQTPNDGCCFMAGSNDGDDQITNRHNKHGNQGFADGHVESCLPEDYGFNTNHPNDSSYTDIVKRDRYCDLFFHN